MALTMTVIMTVMMMMEDLNRGTERRADGDFGLSARRTEMVRRTLETFPLASCGMVMNLHRLVTSAIPSLRRRKGAGSCGTRELG